MQPELTDLNQPPRSSPTRRRQLSFSAPSRLRFHLIARMTRIIDRVRDLNMIADDDASRTHLKSDIPRSEAPRTAHEHRDLPGRWQRDSHHRARHIGVRQRPCGVRHEPLAGVLFMVALGLLGGALFTLAREVRIGLNDFDHYG